MTPIKKRGVFAILLLLSISFGITEAVKSQTFVEEKMGTVAGSISLEDRSWLTQYHEFKFARTDLLDPQTGEVFDSLRRSKSWRNAHYGSLYGDIRLVGYLKDFKEGKKWVFLYRLFLPAGKYAFSQLELFSNSPEIRPSQKFIIDVPFEVEWGKTRYVGEMNFNAKSQKLQLINRREMDIGALQKKYPDLVFSEE